MKKSTIYKIIISVWLLLLLLSFNDLIRPIYQSRSRSGIITFIVILATLFVSYFWLNGIKDIVYTLYFYLFHRHKSNNQISNRKPLVDIVYVTCNDFNEGSLLRSIKQDYTNCRVIILDDSTRIEYICKINKFAEDNNIKISRRLDNVGYKAGNLNSYLMTTQAEYFVILDSDEIIPENFISLALPYFENPNISIVQGNHDSINSSNNFMNRFSDGIYSHWNTYQNIKSNYGFLSFLGHGAMIKTSTYKQVGGFPHLVAEDLCLSIELRNINQYVIFAPEIVCYEEYPVNYAAFKKRHAKWTMGNMEFIKKYTLKIMRSRMHWYEKLDILLFTYNLPLSVVFIMYLFINLVVLPSLDYSINYPPILLLPTVIALIAPLLNDIIYMFSSGKIKKIPLYALSCILLYGSVFYISFKSSAKSVFGKATFIVTPKTSENVSIKDAIRMNYEDILFALGLSILSITMLQSILPVILIVIPTFMSLYLSRLSNIKI